MLRSFQQLNSVDDIPGPQGIQQSLESHLSEPGQSAILLGTWDSTHITQLVLLATCHLLSSVRTLTALTFPCDRWQTLWCLWPYSAFMYPHCSQQGDNEVGSWGIYRIDRNIQDLIIIGKSYEGVFAWKSPLGRTPPTKIAVLRVIPWDFPGGPVAKTLGFQCRGPRSGK